MQDQAQTSTPDLAGLNSQLAANAARVSQYVDTLTARVDRLVEATMAEDWQEVRRLSDHLARNSTNYGYPAIGERARRVCDEMDRPGEAEENVLEIKRSVLRLIGACGRAKLCKSSRPALQKEAGIERKSEIRNRTTVSQTLPLAPNS